MCTLDCLQTHVSRVVYVSMYHFPKMELTFMISKKKVLEDYTDSRLKIKPPKKKNMVIVGEIMFIKGKK